MMKRLIALCLLLLTLAAPAFAQDWTAGQQTITYTDAHPIGDGVTNARGGEAPYFSIEPADISTQGSLVPKFTGTISGTTVSISNLTGALTNGQPLVGNGIAFGVTLSGCTGTPTTSCTISSAQNASFTGRIDNGTAGTAGNTLTASSITGPVNIGAVVSGTGVPANTVILSNIDSTHWVVSQTANVASEAMTSAPPQGPMVSGWLQTCSAIDACGGNTTATGEFEGPVVNVTARIDNGTPGNAGNILTVPNGTNVKLYDQVSGSGITTARVMAGTGTTWIISGNAQNIPSQTITIGNGHEAKARFDCTDAFDEPSDPILKPGQSGTSSHDHHFFGAISPQGNMASVNYAWLRANGGNSTCYGGPLNRTEYWEPTLYTSVNGLKVSIRAANIVTYYNIGNLDANFSAQFTRWPRGYAFIMGFDFNDPANQRLRNHIAASTATVTPVYSFANQGAIQQANGFAGWFCQDYPSVANPGPSGETVSYTAYSPVQQTAVPQPYLSDGLGHPTLVCLNNTEASTVEGSPGRANANNMGGNAVEIYAQLSSPDCWDGQNPRSPNGRDHVTYAINFGGTNQCPDHWYRITTFQPKIAFMLKNNAEIGNVWLSSDKMPGMNLATFAASISGTTLTVTNPSGANILNDISGHLVTGAGIPAGTMINRASCAQNGSGQITSCTLNTNVGTIASETVAIPYNGGETMHADLFPAWGYGTGDNPGPMALFFQNCNGISMHLKNSDGTTYTDLQGDPHECAFGRTGPNSQLYNTGSSPDGSSPNPVVNLNQDLSLVNRYFPAANGTPLPGSMLHMHN